MKDLGESGEKDLAVFGGKAHGLYRLIQEGADVPEGFAVEASADSAWSEEVRELFHDKVKPLLQKGPVAIRSSALGEDSETQSFAGLFKTSLGVKTVEEAFKAAKDGIESGRRERVKTYAGAKSLPVGLVVQSQIAPRAAGVCFTRDPSGKDGAVVIEAVSGLGEQLVSGHAHPERWRAYLSGLNDWECHEEKKYEVLEPTDVKRLASRAHFLEKRFGHPLDLEWAIDASGVIWWLQARPVTSGKDPPRFFIERFFEGVDDGPVSVWSDWNVGETLPRPLTPFSRSWWKHACIPHIVSLLSGIPLSSPLITWLAPIDFINGRLFINMNAAILAPGIHLLVDSMDARTGKTVKQLKEKGVLTPRRLPWPFWKVMREVIPGVLLVLLRFSRGFAPRKGLKSLREAGEEFIRKKDVRLLTNRELLYEMKIFDHPGSLRLQYGLYLQGVAVAVYVAAGFVFRGHENALNLLGSGIPDNPTTQISIAIDELTEAAVPVSEIFMEPLTDDQLFEKLKTTEEGGRWLNRFSDFILYYGFRGPYEFDVCAIRWSEDPSMIIDLIRSGLKQPKKERVRDRMKRLAKERRQAIEQAMADSPHWRRLLMRIFARLVEMYMPLREAPKHYTMAAFHRIQKAVRELGRRLAASNAIDQPEDVYYLTSNEIEGLVNDGYDFSECRETIQRRKEQMEKFLAEPASHVVRSDGVPVLYDSPEYQTTEDGVLKGTGVSSGTATGKVCVLNEPDPKAMTDGDVIVVKYADPGWTPLFPRSCAVIMEIGGLMCHAAIVAREIGIPAVFGIPYAAQILENGIEVTVDGNSGTVSIH
jgi:pyruvate,water dikinase